ncbi:unannotated protein [freshwater metagenome]|uniref:Unannotated protein n=1 Tax=freshwater metagenome TaxID=449393 RepID=A0A6J7KJR1_9ZZZZ
MNGAFGLSVLGDSSVDLTVKALPERLWTNSLAPASSNNKMFAADFSFRPPLASKSFVAATLLPSNESNLALKPASHCAVKSHHLDEMNAMRSRSRSTISRVATDCTRPAEILGITFFHKTGERRYP